MNNIKSSIKNNWQCAKTVCKNVAEFIDAACLTAVSGFAVFTSLHRTGYWYKALLFAGLVIALQAFVLLVRHFNKPVVTAKK